MKRFGFVVALCLALGMTACSNGDDATEQSGNVGEQLAAPEQEEVIDSAFCLNAAQQAQITPLNDFSVSLFRELGSGKNSTVISPLSVAFVMGMINNGASGSTRQEILTALGFGVDDTAAANELMRKMIDGAPTADASVKVAIANNLTVNNTYQLSTDYKQLASTYYDASAYSLDFSQPEALQTINGWCNEKTNGLIPQIIDRLDPQTVLCLLNAIYFKGEWTDKFDKTNTYGEGFVTAESYNTLQMMHKTGKAMFAEQEGMTALRLPFGNGRYTMTFLLPAEVNGLESMKAKLTGKTLQELAFAEQEVEMMLPVFATEVNTDLIPLLSKLGVSRLFTHDAELTDIAKRDGNDVTLFVQLMKQKTRLGVDEEGSLGAAVTIAEMYETEGPDDGSKLKHFYANHPFVYVVSEQATGAILFLGQFCGE